MVERRRKKHTQESNISGSRFFLNLLQLHDHFPSWLDVLTLFFFGLWKTRHVSSLAVPSRAVRVYMKYNDVRPSVHPSIHPSVRQFRPDQPVRSTKNGKAQSWTQLITFVPSSSWMFRAILRGWPLSFLLVRTENVSTLLQLGLPRALFEGGRKTSSSFPSSASGTTQLNPISAIEQMQLRQNQAWKRRRMKLHHAHARQRQRQAELYSLSWVEKRGQDRWDGKSRGSFFSFSFQFNSLRLPATKPLWSVYREELTSKAGSRKKKRPSLGANFSNLDHGLS